MTGVPNKQDCPALVGYCVGVADTSAGLTTHMMRLQTTDMSREELQKRIDEIQVGAYLKLPVHSTGIQAAALPCDSLLSGQVV